MSLDDVFDDGEAEAGAALLARTRFVHAIKSFEDAFEGLGRNSGAIILHENFVFPSTDPSSDKPFVIMGLRLPREPH